jgi:hypothetical protein
MHFRILVIAFGVLAAFAGRTASIAEASELQVGLRLRGSRSVSISHGAAPSLTDTLDGDDHVVTFVVPLLVADARGTAAGWNLTMTSTAFKTSATKSLADDASTLTGVTTACAGTCTDPANPIGYPLALPAGSTAPPAVVFFQALPGTGLGSFTIDATAQLAIPGDAYAGKYKSTLTYAVTTGP